MGIKTDHEINMFCTIEIHPGKREFDCTVKLNKNGAEEPKDVWYYGEWVPLKKVLKIENASSAAYYGYRNAL